jgi:cytochrome c peroxidase
MSRLVAQPQGPLPPPPVPPENPITAAKANLGKVLFWDEQLSSTRTAACATCHMFEAGGADPRSNQALHPGRDGQFGTPDDVHGSPGVVASNADGTYVRTASFGLRPQVTRRRSQGILMSAYSPLQFWDGRAGGQLIDPVGGQTVIPAGASLESQVLQPPVSDVEMSHIGATWPQVVARVAASRPLGLATDIPPALDAWIGTRSYGDLFLEAFGSRDVTAVRIAMAIATYERTLVPNQAPIDAFLAGNPNALTQQELRGRNVFLQNARCGICHGGPTFASGNPQQGIFLNIGVRPAPEDQGRFEVTGNPVNSGAFKVPSLRNVGLRSPLFHNGGKRSLEEVVDFYARGGDFRGPPQTNLIQPFALVPQDRDALLAFLRRPLTDPRVPGRQPPFDHPTLYTQGNRAPAAYGAGGPGTGGITPAIVAIEPPFVGNPSFALAVDGGLGGAPAVLVCDAAPETLGRALLGVPLQVAFSSAHFPIPLGLLRGSGAGAGWTSLAFALPGDAGLAGQSLYLQAFTLDAGAPAGLAGTPGTRVTFFTAR